jgi:sugar lactone lactonase YvrE
MSEAVCVVDIRARIGECPVWVPEEQALYWAEIYKPALHRFDPATGATKTWSLPEPIGSFALRRGGGIVAGLRTGFAFVDLDTGAVEIVASPEQEKPANRLNDGRCDRRGRFWAGSMVEGMKGSDAMLYRLDPDRSCHAMVGGLAVSNGLAWNPDDKVMYHADSPRRTVWAWDFDFDTGAIHNRRVFAEAAPGEGFPDGAAVDAEGCYWSARFKGWRLVRHAPDGREIATIKLPVENPTMCAFGGEKLDVLYVTSGAEGVTDFAQQPHAGGVLALEVGVRGLPEPRFAG